MNYTTGSTSTAKAFTLKDIDEAVKKLSKHNQKSYRLLCPNGRVFEDADPWKLAALSGELPAILKTPLPEDDEQGGAS